MHIQSLSFSYLSTKVLQRFMFMLFWMLSPIAAYADAKVGPHKNGPAGQLSAAHKALICAIQENNLQKVTALLRDKKNINSQDFLGYSPLHYAAKYAKETIVARLLEAKPLLDQVSVQSGHTPLLLAIRRGHKKIVALLLTAGANPNMVNHAGYNGLQLAIQQNRKDLVKLLLQAGASCNILPSPLLMAIKQRSLPIVQCLLQQEKIIETQDSQGFTELHWAAKQNIVTIFRLLLNADCFNVNAKAANGAAPLHLIAANKKIRLLKAVLQCPLLEVNVQDSTGSTPLHYAVATNQLKAVNALLGHPCIKVNLQNNRGQTTLHYAVLYERTAILKKLLPYTGKGIFIRNQEGITPLELAMRQNNATMHKLILAHTSLLSVD